MRKINDDRAGGDFNLNASRSRSRRPVAGAEADLILACGAPFAAADREQGDFSDLRAPSRTGSLVKRVVLNFGDL